MRLVTLSPSRPASGLELIEKVMASVGGSTGIAGIGSVTAGSHRVWATVAVVSPAMATMSPADAWSTGTRSSPRNDSSLEMRPCSTLVPSASSALMVMPMRTVPASIRPVSTRPRKASRSNRLASMANGWPPAPSRIGAGSGTWARISSNSGARSGPGRPASAEAQPSRPEAYRQGKSSCSSDASSAANRSNTASCAQSARASALSTLLITTIGFKPSARAFWVTNLVCGIGPSAASTSSSTPSTMDRMRSTSPPKSAWPGVSTMLMRAAPHSTEVHLARMVMPRSRSRSWLSMARSATRWLARTAPDWRNSWSTSVVLPWST